MIILADLVDPPMVGLWRWVPDRSHWTRPSHMVVWPKWPAGETIPPLGLHVKLQPPLKSPQGNHQLLASMYWSLGLLEAVKLEVSGCRLVAGVSVGSCHDRLLHDLPRMLYHRILDSHKGAHTDSLCWNICQIENAYITSSPEIPAIVPRAI